MTTIKEQMIIDYAEKGISDSKVYRLLNQICDAEKKLMDSLDENQLELLRKFRDLEDKKFAIDIDNALIYGFEYCLSVFRQLKEI